MNVNGFLLDIIQNKKPVIMFLVNGVKLQGTIIQYDPDYGYLLERDKRCQLILPHAVSTISERADVNEK